MLQENEEKEFCQEIKFNEDHFKQIRIFLTSNNYSFHKLSKHQSTNSFSQQYLLGQGRTSVVINGINITSNLEVAIKLSYLDEIEYTIKEEILNKIKVMNDKQYVAEVYESYYLKDVQIYIQIMELCQSSLEKESLEKIQMSNPYTIKEVAHIILTTLNALLSIHSCDIYHLNIKPSNILISFDGTYKLVDFGCSYMNFEEDSTIYLSPELQQKLILMKDERNQKYINNTILQQLKNQAASDVYSLGITLLVSLGIEFNIQNIKSIQEREFSKLEELMQLEHKNFLTFIKYFMLSIHPENRYLPSILRFNLINDYEHLINIELEQRLIKKKINNYESQCIIKDKQYAYLQLALSQSRLYEYKLEGIEASLEILNKITVQPSFDKFIFLQENARILLLQNQYQLSLKNYLQSQEILLNLELNHDLLIAQQLLTFTIIYEQTGRLEDALDISLKYYNSVKQVCEENHPLIATLLYVIGFIQHLLKDFNSSLDYNLQSLKMKQNIYFGDHKQLSISLRGVGISYYGLKDSNKCVEYLAKALKIRENIHTNESKQVALLLDNLGIGYSQLGDFDQSFIYHLKALKMRQNSIRTDLLEIAQSQNNIGAILGKRQEYMKSLLYFKIAFKGYQQEFKENYTIDMLSFCKNVMIGFYRLKDYDKLKKYFQKCQRMIFQIYPQNNNPHLIDNQKQMTIIKKSL